VSDGYGVVRARRVGPQLLRHVWTVLGRASTWPRVWRVGVLIALAGTVWQFLLWVAARHGFFDLRVYYGAISYWVQDGGSIYDYILPTSTYGFTYPPFAAIAMLPMAGLPWLAAVVVSTTASVAVTLILLYWLVDPLARRYGWSRWFALGVAACLAAAFEPLRETINFGQVNMLLVFLVAADLMLLVRHGRPGGGVGIGLATAVKLTPGIFILYLLVTRRWRAAVVAGATAATATIAAMVLAPDASRVFWTDALWNTDRVGSLAFISNQSLEGAVARLHPSAPSMLLWAGAGVAVLVIWARRIRAAAAVGDEWTGFALTGIVGCLLSPITWVHHLVWVGPAVLLVFHRALAARGRQRAWLFGFGACAYVLLCSRLVWNFSDRFDHPVGWFLSSAYVWISIALLVALPIEAPRPRATPSPPAPELSAAPPAEDPTGTGSPGAQPDIVGAAR
jgi:alpha-1,2-mannosyltransferase